MARTSLFRIICMTLHHCHTPTRERSDIKRLRERAWHFSFSLAVIMWNYNYTTLSRGIHFCGLNDYVKVILYLRMLFINVYLKELKNINVTSSSHLFFINTQPSRFSTLVPHTKGRTTRCHGHSTTWKEKLYDRPKSSIRQRKERKTRNKILKELATLLLTTN